MYSIAALVDWLCLICGIKLHSLAILFVIYTLPRTARYTLGFFKENSLHMNFFSYLKRQKSLGFSFLPIPSYCPRQVFFPFSQAFATFSQILATSCQWLIQTLRPFRKWYFICLKIILPFSNTESKTVFRHFVSSIPGPSCVEENWVIDDGVLIF